MRFLRKQGFNLKIYFVSFAVLLIYLSQKFPIQIPITDDWLYLELGSHQSSILSNSLFELVGGHQQVLTKITVWLAGFMPGSYIQNLIVFNIFFALYGFYLLIVSQYVHKSKTIDPIFTILSIVLVFNLKPIYLYMSATGLGLCQSVFLFGIYYYARNLQRSRKSQILIALSLFLAPFTTGMGLALPIAHSLHLIYEFISKRKNLNWNDIWIVLVINLSLVLSYAFPIYQGNLNRRTPPSDTNSFMNVLMIFEDPLNFCTFFIALVGNPLVPSSRFDPLFPFALGFIVLALFIILIYRSIGLSKLLQTIMMNKNPFLTGFVFLFIVTSFRSSNEAFSPDTAAPRFVFGAMFLLLGMTTILVGNYSSIQKRIDKYLLVFFLIIMSFSITGIKTGSEWIITRSLQSESVYECISRAQMQPKQCVSVSSIIREADTKDKELEEDLNRLQNYFNKLNNFKTY
jgi:hypothetical protein